MEKKKVILDVDTGTDDSLAIMLAGKSPLLEIMGITVTAGNVGLEHTVRNTLQILELIGREDIEVAAGAYGPLIVDLKDASHVHGGNGLNNIELPVPKKQTEAMHAVNLLIDLVNKYPGEITIIPLGPLTNIALAIIMDRDFASKVKEIVLMGGAAYVPGNHSPVGEFNIYTDPEAAKVVFDSEIPITMVGLDVTEKTIFTREDLKDIVDKKQNKETKYVEAVINYYYDNLTWIAPYFYMHDPLAVGYVIDNSILKTKKFKVKIETKAEYTRGMTVVASNTNSFDDFEGDKKVDVALEVDVDKFIKLWKNAILS